MALTDEELLHVLERNLDQEAAIALLDKLNSGGNGPLGFYGKNPVAQPAAPVTLADVIAGLKALGLFAS